MVLTTVIILILVGCFLNGRRRGLLMMVLYAATYLPYDALTEAVSRLHFSVAKS